jgi:hypothetical protein
MQLQAKVYEAVGMGAGEETEEPAEEAAPEPEEASAED